MHEMNVADNHKTLTLTLALTLKEAHTHGLGLEKRRAASNLCIDQGFRVFGPANPETLKPV